MNRRTGISILAVLLTGAAQTAPAATITVNTTADNIAGGDGQCTLREAIANVNAAADTTGGDCAAGTGTGDTVTFALTLPPRASYATIELALGQLVIERDVSIVGPTAVELHLSGARKSRIFRIETGVTAGISDLTIEQGWIAGRVAPYGGAVYNSGTLTLTNCTLTNNRSPEGPSAGAIYNMGTLTLTNCRLTNNRSPKGGGGAISNGGTMTLFNCTLMHNRARAGGAIANTGTMTLTDCSLARNLAVSRTTYPLGGAIDNNGTLTMTNCTLDKNRAGQAGGIYNDSTMILTNCTLTRNYARWGAGGGIGNLGAITLTNCTISGNKTWMGRHSLGGGGLWQYPADQDPNGVGGTALVTNTIIAGNGKAHDCGGNRPISGGHNLDSDGNCFTAGGTDLVNTDPLLAPLGDYGGPTPTLALCTGAGVPDLACLAASPAIDAGDDAVTGPPLNLTTDQRGLPRLSGAHADIGAYEAQQ